MAAIPVPPVIASGEYMIIHAGTLADYERAATEDNRLEFLKGVLIMHSPASVRHERLFGFLFKLLGGYAEETGAGEVLGSRVCVSIDDRYRMEPDLLFVRTEHLDRLDDSGLNGPPDLAIEILSPSTRKYDAGDKRDAYADSAVPEYWMIDPLSRRLTIDRPAGTKVFEASRGRCESHTLPGFWVDAEWLWREPLPSVGECLTKILPP